MIRTRANYNKASNKITHQDWLTVAGLRLANFGQMNNRNHSFMRNLCTK